MHIRQSSAAPDAEMCPAAIVGVAIIQIQIGSEYTHTGINTLQSIDIILADCKQNRGEGGRGGGWWPSYTGTVCQCSALALSVKGHRKGGVGSHAAMGTSADICHILTSSLERCWRLELIKVMGKLFK